MENYLEGLCLGIWREKPLPPEFKKVLEDYAIHLNPSCTSISIRFKELKFKTTYEEDQVINAIGYKPVEEIVICSFVEPLFYAIDEVMRLFGGYLQAGYPDSAIPPIKGKVYKIYYEDKDSPPTYKRKYYLVDWEFFHNYYILRRDPAVVKLFSLDDYMVHGVKLKDLMSSKPIN